MKLGICSMWGPSFDAFRAEVRAARDNALDVITVGDSPAGWHELYISLTVAAMDAPNITLAPLVTSPYMRHPIVTADALATLYDINGGKVALGIGTGGSTVKAVGQKKAPQALAREEMLAIKALLRGESATFGGRPVSAMRFPRPIPVYYSAFGPKAMALAGEVADGVILFAGDRELDKLAASIEAVRTAARNNGRRPEDIDIWVTSYLSIRDSRAAAIRDLSAFIVCNALAYFRTPEQIAAAPKDLQPKLLELQRRYDVTEHVVVGGRNAKLLEEVGLTDFLSNISTTAGSPAEVAATIRAARDLGASTFLAALPGNADPVGTIERLAKVRKLL
jgi:5,10-methylenetetrahydromethanopterin reductase